MPKKERSIWKAIMNRLILTLCLLALSCTTPPETTDTFDQCYCGNVVDEGIAMCAVWEKNADLSSPKTFLNKKDGSCTQNSCKKLSKMCRQTVSWSFKVEAKQPSQKAESCYCDEVVVKMGKQTISACASWRAKDKHLIEYYATEKCTPKTCKKAPFHSSNRLCRGGFTSFYKVKSP